MTVRRKCPGNAQQRKTRAGLEIQSQTNSKTQTYDICADLQRRHLRNRCGLTDARAQLIAALLFGEGT